MDALQFEIARFLAKKARQKSRTTYQEVGEAIGWNHPTGRGLRNNLEVILKYLHDEGLPPLTTILVRKGERYPAEDAMAYITNVLGNIDIEAAQNEVFSFDWQSVDSLSPQETVPQDRPDVWLTSAWGFTPEKWGHIGFADENKRNRFIENTSSPTLVAIYITKDSGPKDMRGKVVGIYEVSHETGNARDFISGDLLREMERDENSNGKWPFALRATRAWKIIPEDWKPVEQLFPETYASNNPRYIGANSVPIQPDEIKNLFNLEAYEVPVFGKSNGISEMIAPLGQHIEPSRAVYPATLPYQVGETDGPKHLYILKLEGNIAHFLGRAPESLEGKSIIKVGLSKSPRTRISQIQGHYPDGAFRWAVLFPSTIPEAAPYPNFAVAVQGENAMKAKLVDSNAEPLGGEFFLADDWLVAKIWSAGNLAAERAKPYGNLAE